MLLCEKIDLDLENPKHVYQNAIETIEYLQDVVKSLDKRVLGGEKIDGFVLIPGRKTRIITQDGIAYLDRVLGHDKVYKTIESAIGITEVEKLLDAEDIAALITKGYIVYKEGSPKVGIVKGE